MKSKRANRISLAAIVTMAAGVPSVYAQAKPAEATQHRQAPALMRRSEEGNVALHEVQGARIALFDGDTQKASELVTKAQASLDAAMKEGSSFVVSDTTGMNRQIVDDSIEGSKTRMVPIETQLSFSDSFVPTPENRPHLEQANAHLEAGQTKEALAELRLAKVDVTYTRALLPLDATKKRVAEAAGLMAGNKFYEANLALKNAETGVVVKTASLLETVAAPSAAQPKQKT